MNLTLMALLLSLIIPVSAMAQDDKKAKKEKKPKKEFVWEMPEEMSGNDVVDKYLLTCDSVNAQVHHFTENITYYKPAYIQATDKDGKPMVDEKGLPLMTVAVVSETDPSVKRTSREAFSQYLEIGKSASQLLLTITKLGTRTANATAALPSLGLKALSYGKYVKAGPKLISSASSELNGIIKRCTEQRKQIREMKKGLTQQQADANATVDASGINIDDVEVIQVSYDEFARLDAGSNIDDETDLELD